jgi:acyl carrier protein
MTNSQDQTIELRVQSAIARALRLKSFDPATPLRMGSTPGWDSMGHMSVVMEVEREFNASFPPYRLPELMDVPSIVTAVQNSPAK